MERLPVFIQRDRHAHEVFHVKRSLGQGLVGQFDLDQVLQCAHSALSDPCHGQHPFRLVAGSRQMLGQKAVRLGEGGRADEIDISLVGPGRRGFGLRLARGLDLDRRRLDLCVRGEKRLYLRHHVDRGGRGSQKPLQALANALHRHRVSQPLRLIQRVEQTGQALCTAGLQPPQFRFCPRLPAQVSRGKKVESH